MSRVIDVMHLGRERVICAYEIDGWIVDPGPSSSVETLLEGLAGEAPRGLLLTHIHLDHAGSSGVLARRFPGLPVYVHERGAPHLADPSKLLASATQLYGDDMERLWGEVAPVPEENLRVVSGGETVEGFRVIYTPGHASHHVTYFHEDTGDAFVGDTAGVHIPPSIVTLAPTPPPDIHIEKWLDSLDAIEALEPRRLCLTHFGHEYAVADQLDAMRHALRTWAELAAESDQEKFVAELRAAVRENADPDTAEAFFQAAPPDQLYLGLARYWTKKAEKEAVR